MTIDYAIIAGFFIASFLNLVCIQKICRLILNICPLPQHPTSRCLPGFDAFVEGDAVEVVAAHMNVGLLAGQLCFGGGDAGFVA